MRKICPLCGEIADVHYSDLKSEVDSWVKHVKRNHPKPYSEIDMLILETYKKYKKVKNIWHRLKNGLAALHTSQQIFKSVGADDVYDLTKIPWGVGNKKAAVAYENWQKNWDELLRLLEKDLDPKQREDLILVWEDLGGEELPADIEDWEIRVRIHEKRRNPEMG